jgi:hypothetical protein
VTALAGGVVRGLPSGLCGHAAGTQCCCRGKAWGQESFDHCSLPAALANVFDAPIWVEFFPMPPPPCDPEVGLAPDRFGASPKHRDAGHRAAQYRGGTMAWLAVRGTQMQNGPLARPVCSATSVARRYTIHSMATNMNTAKKITPKIAPRRQ